MKLSRVAALMTCLSMAAAQNGAGLSASLSTAGVQYFADALLPVLKSKFSSLSIPGVSGEKDGFDYSLGNIACNNIDITAVTVSSSSSTGANVALSGLGVSCSADWSFKLKDWPHLPRGSGSVDITVSSASINLGVLVTATADGHAQLTPENVALNPGSINLSFHGSLWDWLIDIFKGFIEKAVTDGISSAFPSIVSDFVSTDLNALLLKVSTIAPLHVRAPYDIAAIRFGLTQNPTFTAQYLGAALQGDIVPIANPATPPITPPVLPPFDPASGSHYLQMHMSSYTALSAVYTYYHAGLMNWPVASSSMPLGLNSTRTYVLIAPGLPLAYPGCTVSLNLEVSDMPNILISPSGVNVTVPVNFQFLVNANNGSIVTAFTLQAVTQLDAAVTVGTDSTGGMAIFSVLQYLSSNITVVNTNVGTVNAGLLQTLVDFVFNTIAVPAFNKIFADGIPIPAVDGLALTNTAINYASGYVTFASDFTFNPSTALHVQPLKYFLNNKGLLRAVAA